MAKDTLKTLRNKVIYEIYVRNHGSNGTFLDIMDDLERIKELGADIIWLMPIHPIGQKNKKGTLGCPYSIKDYKAINEEYGTLKDFMELIEKVHALDMKIMIDVVYNHTSHDADYLKEHPEYYYRNADGSTGNKIADWDDIIDLDYANKDLWEEQIIALEYWTKLGVDGFRCDVAPMVPMEFWSQARERIRSINPGSILLAESVHPHFIEWVRNQGFYMASDSETYEAFDICYDYDTHGELHKYLSGDIELESLLIKKRMQEHIYPENYVKLRFLENHDQPRIASLIKSEKLLKMWTAFMFFEKGATLLYAGQEAKDQKCPSLFDKDLINWNDLNEEFCDFIKQLGAIKKEAIFAEGCYKIHHTPKKDVILATYVDQEQWVIGIFNIGLKSGEFKLVSHEEGYFDLPSIQDGNYVNRYTSEEIKVVNQMIQLIDEPILFHIKIK
ncbi:alpha-amylase family glycosyl hydrolase [Vallitalea okinawensis]|uniref:alpha-amylase family glycosyl hydrolase n=1 Tax=Vallitalea okinawensis TaxID=2078660 RepID=UPI000CFA9D92|nr:alpha-amylase family glycosyl hydrolase [Vallitalea okinawensis]